MARAYLGLGSNLGDRAANLMVGLRLLSSAAVLERLSSLYETDPVGYSDQPRFLNAVCRVSTDLGPGELLSLAKAAESALGRKPTFRNAPRPLDVDILLYGQELLQTPELTVPHPRLAERAFVLVPLAEIAADEIVPGVGRSVAELLDALGGLSGVEKYAPPQDSPASGG